MDTFYNNSLINMELKYWITKTFYSHIYINVHFCLVIFKEYCILAHLYLK